MLQYFTRNDVKKKIQTAIANSSIAELEKQVQQLSNERDNLQQVIDILRQK